MTVPAEPRWPGERLGLPESGPRSVARFGRRLAAICIDWALALLVSFGFFPVRDPDPEIWPTTDPWITLTVFGLTQVVFLWLLNGSVGHVLLGMRVVPVAPARLGWWRPLVRTALLCLAVPALIWDRDQRGLHDRAAGTVLVRFARRRA